MPLPFKHIKQFINVRYDRKVSTRRSLLLFFYQTTAAVLFVSSLLVSGTQYFGQPIECVQDKTGDEATINEKVLNTFCFISNTYTLTNDVLGNECEDKRIYQGVGPDGSEIRRHAYYIWTPFVLFFQGLSFLIPSWYWFQNGGGFIDKLVTGLTEIELTSESREKANARIRQLSVYFQKRMYTHSMFVLDWFLTDLLALGIITGNFYITDLLLGGRFINYGIKIFNFSGPEVGNCGNAMEDAFPKITKCTFRKFGPSGSVQSLDSLCVMAQNVINQKIYTVLWFWFFTLLPITFFWILIKIGAMLCLSSRRAAGLLNRKWVQEYAVGVPPTASTVRLRDLAKYFSASDWIFYSHLVSNLNTASYIAFSSHLHDLIDGLI